MAGPGGAVGASAEKPFTCVGTNTAYSRNGTDLGSEDGSPSHAALHISCVATSSQAVESLKCS